MLSSSRDTTLRRCLYLAVAVLLALNCVFLWRDYSKEQDRQNLLQRVYNAQVEVRVLKSEKIFGAPFIPQFHAVDLQDRPTVLPDVENEYQLLLFFQSWHCATCLEAISLFDSVIGDEVPVIGISQGSSPDEIMPILDAYEYKFPVYLAVDSPFNLMLSPYSALIDGGGNVLHLSPIDSNIQSTERLISELARLLEGG